MTLARFKVSTDGLTVGLEVNGVDLSSGIEQIIFEQANGEVPRLGVRFRGDVSLEGEGIIHVLPTVDGDPRELILAFLESVDPVALDAAALEEQSLDDAPGKGFIDALKRLVE
jgi:hypothetical protein